MSLWKPLVASYNYSPSVSSTFSGTADDTVAYLVHDDHQADEMEDFSGVIEAFLLFGLLLWAVLNYHLLSRATQTLYRSNYHSDTQDSFKIKINEGPTTEDEFENKCSGRVVSMSPKRVCATAESRFSPPPQVSELYDTVFAFLGTFFNQDLQLTPRTMTLKAIVATWSFSGIFLTTLYTSYITAQNIKPSTSLPVSTFEELLQNEQYRFYLSQWEDTVNSALKQADENSILGRIYSRVVETCSMTNACDTEEDLIKEFLATPNAVLLISHSYIWNFSELNRTVLRLDELLFSLNRGFIFPTTSELNEVVSRKLMEFDELGVTAELRNTKWSYEELLSHKRQDKDGFSGNGDLKPADVSELMWLFEVCGFCVGVAFVALLIENLIACVFCKTLQSDVTDVRPDEEEPVDEKRMDGENIMSLDLNGEQSYCHESETDVS